MPVPQSEQLVKLLEVQSVKLNEVKNNLRLNRYKAQQDIRQAIAAMIVSLRERERQLIGDLDRAFYQKEGKLVNQLDVVAEELAACNLGLPLGSSILNVDDDVRLELDLPISDIRSMHERIVKLGEIRVSQDCQRLPLKKVGRTLPLDMEFYDDDNMWLLTKKSKSDASPETPHEVDTVKNWLSRLPDGNAALNFDLASFASGETKSESSESNASSFELLNEVAMCLKYKANTDKAFRERIDTIHNEPMSKWLLNSDEESTSTHLPRAPVPESFRANEDDDDFDGDDEDMEPERPSDSFKFVDVISKLQNSDDSKWLNPLSGETSDEQEDQSPAANHRRFLKKHFQ
uniref:Mediator complex subunit 17 n=1 Tax=Caenorhabditis tropicalis TaxID=1561998 RepID=A0A1I7T1D3_9PELO